VPFVLGLPGLWLVEAPGLPPTAVESPRGRVLLRGSVWRVDAGQSVVVVERSAR
jgi:membrane protein implicated in regulation of membrane protease activity